MNELGRAASLMAPLIGGLVLHGLCIKHGWLSALARPVDAGLTFRGRRLLGDNKTYRGLLAVAAGTAIGFLLRAALGGASIHEADAPWLDQPGLRTAFFGFLVGAAAMLSEFPNSFVKRQLGIRPGEQGRRIAGLIFYVLDQVDLLLGVCLVLSTVLTLSVGFVLWSAALLFVAHQCLTVAGFALGMRSTWRELPAGLGARQARSKGRRQACGAISWWIDFGPHEPG